MSLGIRPRSPQTLQMIAEGGKSELGEAVQNFGSSFQTGFGIADEISKKREREEKLSREKNVFETQQRRAQRLEDLDTIKFMKETLGPQIEIMRNESPESVEAFLEATKKNPAFAGAIERTGLKDVKIFSSEKGTISFESTAKTKEDLERIESQVRSVPGIAEEDIKSVLQVADAGGTITFNESDRGKSVVARLPDGTKFKVTNEGIIDLTRGVIKERFKKEKKLTQDEKKTREAVSRISKGAEFLANVINDPKKESAAGTGALARLKPEFFKPQIDKQLNARRQDIADAFLRLRTGAAATESEIKDIQTSFFPQVGDDAETIAVKWDLLQENMDALTERSGIDKITLPTLNLGVEIDQDLKARMQSELDEKIIKIEERLEEDTPSTDIGDNEIIEAFTKAKGRPPLPEELDFIKNVRSTKGRR